MSYRAHETAGNFFLVQSGNFLPPKTKCLCQCCNGASVKKQNIDYIILQGRKLYYQKETEQLLISLQKIHTDHILKVFQLIFLNFYL